MNYGCPADAGLVIRLLFVRLMGENGATAAVQFRRRTSAIATAAATATFSDPTRPGCGM